MVAAAAVYPGGFTKFPNVILLDSRLSAPARLLLGLFEFHARGKGVCYVGFERICTLLSVTEKTARRRVRELESAGCVRVERIGWGRVNRYYLLNTDPSQRASERESVVAPERESGPLIEEETHEEEKRAMPVESKPLPMREILSEERTHTQDATDADPEQFIAALATDLRRQLRDKASARATTGRLRNTYRTSGLTRDPFLDAVYEARSRTMKRGGGVAYWFQVLDDVLNAADRPATPHPTMAVPSGSGPLSARETPSAPITAIPDISRPHPPWPSELIEMGIPDVPTYIRQCGRGPFFDPQASIEYARARIGRPRGCAAALLRPICPLETRPDLDQPERAAP